MISEKSTQRISKDTLKVLKTFKENDLLESAYSSVEDALSDIEKKRKMEAKKYIWCGYGGKPRLIHLDVCEWHRRENDPECKECISSERIEKILERGNKHGPLTLLCL